MNGSDYIATVRLASKQDETFAEAGQTCERVPKESIWWLVEQGLIVPVPQKAKEK